MTQGHWVGIKAEPDKFFGFIYRIDCIDTGQSYIGKRQYWSAKQRVKGCKSCVANRASPKWKPACWTEASWKEYRGSSKYLAKFMDENPHYTFTYTIIKNCESRADLVYSEAYYQWKYEVLHAKMPDGTDKFFNHAIAGIKFKPRCFRSEESHKKTSRALTGNQNAKGSIRSEEAKEKYSKAKSGAVVSEETRAKLSALNTGQLHPRSKLTEEDVIAIIKMLPYKTDREIAAMYSVTWGPINSIRNGKTWKHIPRPEVIYKEE